MTEIEGIIDNIMEGKKVKCPYCDSNKVELKVSRDMEPIYVGRVQRGWRIVSTTYIFTCNECHMDISKTDYCHKELR